MDFLMYSSCKPRNNSNEDARYGFGDEDEHEEEKQDSWYSMERQAFKKWKPLLESICCLGSWI